ncbi:MAG: hypothetical protein MRK02_13795 [Candidatus Scalindua sp.]|nr:hypothetical protein [Candidatus Scalindua sp.]
MRTEVTITVSMDPTNFSVLAHCNGKLYEGTSCSTSDFEDEANDNIRVAEEGSEFLRVDLCNGEFAGGDFSRIRLTVTNTRQPSI